MAMFQLGGMMCNAVGRFAPRTIWRISSQQLLTVSNSAVANPDITVPNKSEAVPEKQSNSERNREAMLYHRSVVKQTVATLFDKQKLSTSSQSQNDKQTVFEKISSATTVDQLLAIVAKHEISQENALSIMSILNQWIFEKKASFSQFKYDTRFFKLQKRFYDNSRISENLVSEGSSELATILSLTGVDKAAELISTLDLDQMIKVLTALAYKKQRSMTILRSLSSNISRIAEKLNIKQSADLLYSMALLNFPDEVLLQRIKGDLIECIPKNKGRAVIGSIFSSLGFLRYKNIELLDVLCEWVTANAELLKPLDIKPLLLTLAMVGHIPSNVQEIEELLLKPLKKADLSAPEVWLDIVWAMVVLGLAQPAHVSTVLNSTFLQTLIDSKSLTIPRKMKLLNINAAARLIIPNYKGAFITQELNLNEDKMSKSKEKQVYVSSVMDTLGNLFPLTTCLRRNVNTGMGFVLDGECYVDSKFNPVPIEQASKSQTNVTRIAVIVLDYADFCRGRDDPVGLYTLMTKLLESEGWRTVLVPYTEYDAMEKLVTRVKYLEKKIKSTIKLQST